MILLKRLGGRKHTFPQELENVFYVVCSDTHIWYYDNYVLFLSGLVSFFQEQLVVGI